MFQAWPGWYVYGWLTRRLVCVIFGHHTSKWTGPDKCDRCYSKRVAVNV